MTDISSVADRLMAELNASTERHRESEEMFALGPPSRRNVPHDEVVARPRVKIRFTKHKPTQQPKKGVDWLVKLFDSDTINMHEVLQELKCHCQEFYFAMIRHKLLRAWFLRKKSTYFHESTLIDKREFIKAIFDDNVFFDGQCVWNGEHRHFGRIGSVDNYTNGVLKQGLTVTFTRRLRDGNEKVTFQTLNKHFKPCKYRQL
jgi:hypothetical protein